MKILLAGGGTGGPAIPLLAVQQHILKNNPKARFLFVGTAKGPEKKFAEKYGVPFETITSGKIRRYFSFLNFLAPFQTLTGFIESIFILAKFKPDVIFAAGGYVSVPVILAGFLMRKKIIIHQQDVEPTMSNTISAPFANKITVTFEKSLKDFSSGSGFFAQPKHRVVWTGNPFREELLLDNRPVQELRDVFAIANEMPVVLFTGGATGALALNKILEQALPELVKFCNVIHSTGSGKSISFKHENYHAYELIDDMSAAYKLADLVICRAGLSTITELSALKKVSIVIPIPDSHQLANANLLDHAEAAVVLDQKTLDAEKLVATVKKILFDGQLKKGLSENIASIMPTDAAKKISDIIEGLCR